MPKLLIKPKIGEGRIHHVTPKTAGWTYVGFDLWKLKSGQSAMDHLKDRETCLVFVSGKGHVTVDGKDIGLIGERLSPFLSGTQMRPSLRSDSLIRVSFD